MNSKKSKKKHNINYIKPNEPAFITRMKLAAGYVEGPNVDTKREERPEYDSEDDDERDDERPTIVVLNDGDLTQEEVETAEKLKKEAEKVEKADLTQKVVFKRKNAETSVTTDSTEKPDSKEVKKKKREKEKPKKAVLSFNDEEEEE